MDPCVFLVREHNFANTTIMDTTLILYAQVMLSSVVTHASGNGARSNITTASLTELRRAVDLFREASTFGGRAGKFLVSICNGILNTKQLLTAMPWKPILERLLQKAEQAYRTAIPTVTRRDIFSNTGPKEPKDELSIFSGQVNKVATKAPPPRSSGRPSHSPQNNAQIPSQSPTVQGELSPPEAYSNMHPLLREQWSRFEGDLNTQLYNARRDSYDTEDDTVVVPAQVERLCGPAVVPESTSQAQPVQYQPVQYQPHPVTQQPQQGYQNYFSAPLHGQPVSPVEAQNPHQRESQRQKSVYPSNIQEQHYQHEPQYAQPLPQSHHHQPDHITYHHQQQQQQQQHPGPQTYQHEQYYTHEQPGFESYDPYQSSGVHASGDYNAEPSQSYWESAQQSYQAQESTTYYHQSSYYDNSQMSQQYQAAAPGASLHHLQETWQSFNVYVGSPGRPT